MYSVHVRVWKSIGWRPLSLEEWIFTGSIALMVADNVEIPTEYDFAIAEKVERYILMGNEVDARALVVRLIPGVVPETGEYTSWPHLHSSMSERTNTSNGSSGR